MAITEVEDTDKITCDRDALAGVMALAHPRDAVSFAQSCKDLHAMHQALKASLILETLQQLSSRHILGVAPDTAYVELFIPHELILLIERQLTASEVHSVVLALRPEWSRIQSFVQRAFRDDPGCSLGLRLLVPGSMFMIARRDALACVLRALVSIVTQDLKAAMSSHAQAAKQPVSFQVFYDLNVSINQPSDQSLEELYSEAEEQFGQAVLCEIFDREVATCDVTGKTLEYITWKETGLPALFGRLPSSHQHDSTLGISKVDCAESGSAQLWVFTPLTSQIEPADFIE